MIRLRTLALSVVFLVLFSPQSHAQATVTWFNDDYPAPGANNGTIAIKGTVTPDMGWTVGTVVAFAWPKDGGPVKTYVLTLNMGTFEHEITGLTSNQDYNVAVHAGVSMAGMPRNVANPPRVAKAK